MGYNEENRSIAIIPCYNEESTIADIIQKTKKYVDEVLVIDDGSLDNTAKIAQDAGATVIAHKTNKGKSAGIKTGFKYSIEKNYDFIITLDGDAQHNPNEIPLLLDEIKNNGHDIILGVRYGQNTEMPIWRKVGKRVLDYATSFGNGGYVTDSQCGFRAFNKKAVENLTPRINGKAFAVESEQLIKAHETGLKVGHKDVTCKYKDLDTSTKSPASHGLSVLSYVIWLIIKKRPVIFIGIPSIILLIIGLLLEVNANTTPLISLFLIIGVAGISLSLIYKILPSISEKT